MRVHFFSKAIATATLVGVFTTALWAQEAPKKNWKDRAEYDVYEAITKEQDPAKKVQLLNSWKEKYPESDYQAERLLFYLLTYNQLKQGDRVIETAQEILKGDPKNIQALYFTTLWTVSMGNTTPARLDVGEKAARGLLANLDVTFAPDKRPQSTPEATWKKERDDLEVLARTTVGWVAMSRKQNEAAEQEFVKVLQLHPNNGQVSYWLGSVIAAQQKIEKQAAALYHFARAANLTGAGALPDANRKQIQAYLEKVYVSYHGDKSGLAELVASARANPMPPPDLTIKSKQQILIEQEEELKKTNPQLALWISVKKFLSAPDGPQYFDAEMKDKALPKLKGKVVSGKPEARPKEILLAIATDDQPEMTLVLDAAMSNKAEPGTEIEFDSAVAKAFTQDPFMVTAEVEKENVTGWPPPPKPTPKARPAGKKK